MPLGLAALMEKIENGAAIYRSDNHGAVQINFTSKQVLNIESWRQMHPRYWLDKNITIQKSEIN